MGKFKIYNGLQILNRERRQRAIPTFSNKLDEVLGIKGLQIGAITELIGLAGVGKTQLCLQLCASAQIPTSLGGLSGQVVYIDTDSNFSLGRYKEILTAALKKCRLREMAKSLDQPPMVLLQTQIDAALKKIHCINAIGLESFCASLQNMPKYLSERPGVRIVVIDSLVAPFKNEVSPMERTGLLYKLMAELQTLAVEHKFAILLTNEMSTRLKLPRGPGAPVVPARVLGAMGDLWAHRSNVRIMLSKNAESGERHAVCLKASMYMRYAAPFQITNDGIRDIE